MVEKQFGLRLATYNVRVAHDPYPNDWASRLPRILRMLGRHGIEIAGLQEATKPQLDGILAEGRWGYVGVGRDDGGEKGEYACIIYLKERFQVGASGTFWLSETPDVPGSRSWETACVRICTWARITDLKTGKSFTHFNTHLDHRSKAAQLNGITLILKRMADIAPSGPVVLTGDFNVFPDSAVVTAAEERLHNGYKVTETPRVLPKLSYHGYQGAAHGEGLQGDHVIDYIFVNDGFRVKDLEICEESEDGLYSSDHYPVVAELELQG